MKTSERLICRLPLRIVQLRLGDLSGESDSNKVMKELSFHAKFNPGTKSEMSMMSNTSLIDTKSLGLVNRSESESGRHPIGMRQ